MRSVSERKRFLFVAVITMLGLAPRAWSDVRPLDADRFQADLDALTGTPHRLAGTPEGRQAGAYLEAELRKLSGAVCVQRFSFPQERVEKCELRADGKVIPLQPLRANGLHLSVTPSSGFTGDLVAIDANGNPASPVDGRSRPWIAVADVGTPRALHNAFRCGAAAIVFVGTPAQTRAHFENLVTHISLDLPRFYISQKIAQEHGLKRTKRGTLTSRLRWEKREGRNLFLWIP